MCVCVCVIFDEVVMMMMMMMIIIMIMSMRSVFIVVYDDGNVGDTLFMLYLYNVYVMMHFNLIFVFFYS